MDFEAFNNRDLFLRMWCDRLWDHWYCSAAFVVDTFGGAANRKTPAVCACGDIVDTRHPGVLRRTKPRRKPQIVPQIAFHCRHTTPRGKSRRKPRTANRFIVDVPLVMKNVGEQGLFIVYTRGCTVKLLVVLVWVGCVLVEYLLLYLAMELVSGLNFLILGRSEHDSCLGTGRNHIWSSIREFYAWVWSI